MQQARKDSYMSSHTFTRSHIHASTYRGIQGGIATFVAVVVLGINLLLKFIVALLTDHQKHTTFTSRVSQQRACLNKHVLLLHAGVLKLLLCLHILLAMQHNLVERVALTTFHTHVSRGHCSLLSNHAQEQCFALPHVHSRTCSGEPAHHHYTCVVCAQDRYFVLIACISQLLNTVLLPLLIIWLVLVLLCAQDLYFALIACGSQLLNTVLVLIISFAHVLSVRRTDTLHSLPTAHICSALWCSSALSSYRLNAGPLLCTHCLRITAAEHSVGAAHHQRPCSLSDAQLLPRGDRAVATVSD